METADESTPEAPTVPVVTLVCGASGAGKSRIAVRLAAAYGVPLAEADDVVTALKALTTPHQAPELHFWDTHPEAADWPPQRIARQHFEVADALRPGLLAVIADHIEFGAPVVIEGDYVTPDLAAGFGAAVRAVVIAEDDEHQILANFASREPDGGEQRHRARVSVLVGAELARRADCADRVSTAVVVPARPWHDGWLRADRALRGCPR